MPWQLVGWKPEEKNPLPSPGDEYLEIEAAVAAGYTPGTTRVWAEETVVNKARVIAHHLHKGMREGYTFEHGTKKGKGKGDGSLKAFADKERVRMFNEQLRQKRRQEAAAKAAKK